MKSVSELIAAMPPEDKKRLEKRGRFSAGNYIGGDFAAVGFVFGCASRGKAFACRIRIFAFDCGAFKFRRRGVRKSLHR